MKFSLFMCFLLCAIANLYTKTYFYALIFAIFGTLYMTFCHLTAEAEHKSWKHATEIIFICCKYHDLLL